ncbi:MAG TPA: OmpA family protein [Saprospiraceae bacterium]|nr:OmpA family protein [Saprospiraceae bacterium]HRK79851.1 OmpA family protein [Saprospiraceae bacterium]
MSTPIKILLLLLAWLLYTVFAYRGCKEELCLHCGDGTAGVVAPPAGPEESITRYPIDFQWDNAEAFKNDGADAELKALAAGLQNNNNVLEVTGYYYEGEKAPPGFDNMGFARAARLKDMLAAAGVPADRIQTRARALQGGEDAQKGYFVGYEGNWKVVEQAAEVKTVEELDDRIIIRFPSGSTQKDYDKNVDDYLAKLVARIKETGETVTLSGHTDNVGNADGNLKLGQGRADAVKRLLVKKGAPADQITTESKGQTQPTASNETPEGRHENRRVEVRLNKK